MIIAARFDWTPWLRLEGSQIPRPLIEIFKNGESDVRHAAVDSAGEDLDEMTVDELSVADPLLI